MYRKMINAETQTTANRLYMYLHDKYEKLLRRLNSDTLSLKAIKRITRALQVLSLLLSILTVLLPALETIIPTAGFITIGIGAIGTFIGGLVVIVTDIEKRKRSDLQSNSKKLVKVMKVLDKGSASEEELEKILEIDLVDKEK